MFGGTSLAAFIAPLKLAVCDIDIIPQPASAKLATPTAKVVRHKVKFRFISNLHQ